MSDLPWQANAQRVPIRTRAHPCENIINIDIGLQCWRQLMVSLYAYAWKYCPQHNLEWKLSIAGPSMLLIRVIFLVVVSGGGGWNDACHMFMFLTFLLWSVWILDAALEVGDSSLASDAWNTLWNHNSGLYYVVDRGVVSGGSRRWAGVMILWCYWSILPFDRPRCMVKITSFVCILCVDGAPSSHRHCTN